MTGRRERGCSAVMADGVAAPLPGRCAFFVERKKRYCKMVVGRGKTYCGEHAAADEQSERRRVPCPLDPKHTVYEDSLEKHLKKCNSKEKPKPVYYVKDINSGTVSEEDEADEESIADRSKEELDALIEKLKKALKGLNCKPDCEILSHPALQEALTDPKNGDAASKHLKQHASIMGNMQRLGLLGPRRCYVEFGAGRGKLSHWIHEALQQQDDVHFLLVERSSTRFKVDGKHKNTDSQFDRLQVDIQHLDLSGVPLLRDRGLPVVAVGKHVCGAATDLTLRCLLERGPEEPDAAPTPPKRRRLSEGSAAGPVAVSGLAVALCCHHRCLWTHYVGKDFFRERGLGPREFAAFQRMSSWATCGLTTTGQQSGEKEQEEEAEHEGSEEHQAENLTSVLSTDEREKVGRMCKMLIDHGRLHYLQQNGFKSSLCYYTSRDVSLENVLLTAVPT